MISQSPLRGPSASARMKARYYRKKAIVFGPLCVPCHSAGKQAYRYRHAKTLGNNSIVYLGSRREFGITVAMGTRRDSQHSLPKSTACSVQCHGSGYPPELDAFACGIDCADVA